MEPWYKVATPKVLHQMHQEERSQVYFLCIPIPAGRGQATRRMRSHLRAALKADYFSGESPAVPGIAYLPGWSYPI